ncbi:hypothetical protein ACFQ1S_32105, partial [Kibdelosporangium lantanae]
GSPDVATSTPETAAATTARTRTQVRLIMSSVVSGARPRLGQLGCPGDSGRAWADAVTGWAYLSRRDPAGLTSTFVE